MDDDRGKLGFEAIARGARPAIDYEAFYRVKLLKQKSGTRVDIRPEDRRLPDMADVPIRYGVPGVEATLLPGHLLILGWENGQGDRPYVSLWEAGTAGTVPTKVVHHATEMNLGGPTDPVKDGVVTGQGTDSYTGLPYWMLGNSSAVVGAKK